jgi:hypothetical protein
MKIFACRYMAAAEDGGEGGGGVVDRGDNFVSDGQAGDTAPVVVADADTADTAEAAKVAADETAAAAAAAAEAVKVAADEAEKTKEQTRDEAGKFVKKDDKGASIPKARFDEAVGKERARAEAAEARARQLETQQKAVDRGADIAVTETKIQALELESSKAELDGNVEKMAQLKRDIRLLERSITTNTSTRTSEQIKDELREEMRVDLTIEWLETLHPVLDSAHESYDQDIVDLVLASKRDLMARERLTPSKALETAATKVLSKIAPPVAKAEDPPEPGEKEGLKSADKGTNRELAQKQKNLETVKKQPADMRDSGIDSDKAGQTKELPPADKLSYEEFAALPETTKARMRGDLLG